MADIIARFPWCRLHRFLVQELAQATTEPRVALSKPDVAGSDPVGLSRIRCRAAQL
jgi:hypothetical protein